VAPVLLGLSLVDLALVGGVVVVLPLGLGGPWREWALAGAGVVVACQLDRGTVGAVVLALPWVVVASAAGIRALRTAGPLLFWTRGALVRLLACGYVLFAAAWFVLSRAGARPLGIREPIVQLTAVHFTYVGSGALLLALAALDASPAGLGRRVGALGLWLVAGAPPVVALGFATGAAIPQVGGAVLMTVGVYCTAALQVMAAIRRRGTVMERSLLAISGLAVWVPMVLAMAWAAGQHWDVPLLSVPDMVRTHGAANALGFVLCGLVASRIAPREDAAWS
jgi:hypothetical protein